jgi:hypothetical protein
MTKRITAHLTIEYIQLPADKYIAYVEGMRLLAEMMLAGKQSSPAEEGSLEEGSLTMFPQEILPQAGVANLPTFFEEPAGAPSPSLQAETITGSAG